MKLSTHSRYGMRALIDIARSHDEKPVPLNEIAKRQEISEKYLEHLVVILKNKGFLRSIRGSKGGYVLSKDSSKIKIKDILVALEGPLCFVDCVKDSGLCRRAETCVARGLWKMLSDDIERRLNSITLKDLIERKENKSREEIIYNI